VYSLTNYLIENTSSTPYLARPTERSGVGVVSETRDGAEHITCWPRPSDSYHPVGQHIRSTARPPRARSFFPTHLPYTNRVS
jgi:hypothetical protein